ncbi:DUF5799 family protein [Salinirubellus sp. GCM10025818]|jgi:hypothetical protein|uniref:DUF5799 family protein n=1 Tax=Salinirubellus TaxID=2162630 RepID=UPI0030D404B7
MSGNWTDMIVGDRMAVDNEFNSEVEASEFSRQEWGLIMTAVEFEIEEPGTDRARLVANTDNLPAVMPEMERIAEQQQGMGGGGGSGGAGNGGGILGSLRDALGLGGSAGTDEDRVRAAEDLADAYAKELQRHLEERGKWEQVCATADE